MASWKGSGHLLPAWLLLLALVALSGWLVLLYRRLGQLERFQMPASRILVDASSDLDTTVNHLLDAFGALWGPATPCTAYVFDEAEETYVPRAERNGANRSPLPVRDVPALPTTVHRPDGHFLLLPLGARTVLEAGPFPTPPRAVLRTVASFIPTAVEALEVQTPTPVLPPVELPPPSHFTETFLRLQMAALGIESCLLLAPRPFGGAGAQVRFHAGFSASVIRLVQEDPETGTALLALASTETRLLAQGDPQLQSLPPVLVDGVSGGNLVAVPLEQGRVLLGFSRRPLGKHALGTLELAAARLSGQEKPGAYRNMLESLVDSLDSREPFSHGRSRRIARWSHMTAIEMGLDVKAADAVALAARLHDVGMAGLPTDILLKKGQLTADEYQAAKRHPEIGAALLEPLGIDELASLVRHHHERYDGAGYPLGLQKEQIPLGARIIAVADLFEAKVSPRNYRQSLPFGAALDQLSLASNHHLDPRAAGAFVTAYRKGRIFGERSHLPWENCWTMVQCAEQGRCPAASASEPCWDVSGTLCADHGHNCDNCFVRTEFLFHSEPESTGTQIP